MTMQTTMFTPPRSNPATGQARKEEGVRAVAIHNITFLNAIRHIAVKISRENGGFVTADDLREYADREGIKPNHPNAWGSVFRSAPRGFVFRKTGAYQASRYPSNNGRTIPVWSAEREVQS